MLDTIAVMMGGRISEEMVSGDISSGAAGDIQQATNMARAMVMQWGMSDRLGMVQYGDDDEYIFLGREMARAKVYSEFTAQEIDAEVKRIIDNSYKVAKDLITANADKLELIANSLLEYETLDGSQVEEIVKTGKLTPPPPRSQPEPQEPKADAPSVAERKADEELPGAPGIRWQHSLERGRLTGCQSSPKKASARCAGGTIAVQKWPVSVH